LRTRVESIPCSIRGLSRDAPEKGTQILRRRHLSRHRPASLPARIDPDLRGSHEVPIYLGFRWTDRGPREGEAQGKTVELGFHQWDFWKGKNGGRGAAWKDLALASWYVLQIVT